MHVRIWLRERPIRIERDPGPYDPFVLDFLERVGDLPCVIVSGYVAILFGRERQTEDIDMLVGTDASGWRTFWSALEGGFECHQTQDPTTAWKDYLMAGIAVRFSRPGEIEPNMEVKLVANDVDRFSLENRRTVLLNGHVVPIGPLETQVAFKLWLGSDKDLEDALHLYSVLGPTLDLEQLGAWIKRLGVPADNIARSGIDGI